MYINIYREILLHINLMVIKIIHAHKKEKGIEHNIKHSEIRKESKENKGNKGTIKAIPKQLTKWQ